MFGLSASDTRVTAARKRSYMNDAMERWPWLTLADCLGFETVEQLVSAVQLGSSLSSSRAAAEVAVWMRGKTF